MEWVLPDMERKVLPGFPAWWSWFLLPLLFIAFAGVVLFFVWPVARGFTDLRFWFWLLLAPLLCAGSLSLFWLSHLLNRRREIAYRHLFIDRKYAQWQRWGRHSLKLAAWHLLTPEPELMERILGISGTPPEAPSATLKIPRDTGAELGASPLRQIVLNTLSPVMPVLRTLPVVDISLHIAGFSEEEARQALSESWQTLFNRALPGSRINWLAEAPDAVLLQHLSDTPSDRPRLLICTRFLNNDEKACEFSTALLFVPHNMRLPEQNAFRPVYVYRPLLAPAAAPEKPLASMLSVGQIAATERRHLWDAGLDTRARNTLLSVLEIQGEPMPPEGQHQLSESTGEQGKESLWLALAIAAQATDIGQRGQMIAAPKGESTATVQLSIQPAASVQSPPDTISRYPLAWLVATICLLLFIVLLPAMSIRMEIWPWLLGGGVLSGLLLCFAIPLACMLWHYQLEEEWASLCGRSSS